MRRELDARLAAHGVTSSQWGALVSIGRHKCCTAAELSRWMNLDSGGVSRVIAQLERQGLIERRTVAANRRIREIHLSRRGRNLLPKLEVTTAGVAADFLAGFTESEQAVLLELLAKIPSVLSAG
jgi:MarR family transcriptional regulator for hemolysin